MFFKCEMFNLFLIVTKAIQYMYVSINFVKITNISVQISNNGFKYILNANLSLHDVGETAHLTPQYEKAAQRNDRLAFMRSVRK